LQVAIPVAISHFTAMASDRATLNVSARDRFGSRATRRLRREGMVPGIVYGKGDEARPFQVPERELRHLLLEGHTLLDLQIDGSKAVPVVIKEQQHHPLRGEVMHLDCLEVRLDEEIQSEVPLELEGADQAPGVREGGVLEHVTREVTVEALPTEIPESIAVDVSEMVIGDTISLATVTPPAGTKFMVDEPEEITIATLSPPRVEEEPEVEEEAVLVGEDGEPIEGEEVPEGAEAPAEGDGEDEGQPQPERIGEKDDKGGGE
jgi:large subunit ribosomal protein L25